MSEHNHLGIWFSLLGLCIVLIIQEIQIKRVEKEIAD